MSRFGFDVRSTTRGLPPHENKWVLMLGFGNVESTYDDRAHEALLFLWFDHPDPTDGEIEREARTILHKCLESVHE